jgi:hypothetical protein
MTSPELMVTARLGQMVTLSPRWLAEQPLITRHSVLNRTQAKPGRLSRQGLRHVVVGTRQRPPQGHTKLETE